MVLWAFRANKINDQDTIDALNNLSQHSKSILGVLTNFDRVPTIDRPETLQQAYRLYGDKVQEMLGVVAGGNSTERGMGIATLRSRLSEVGADADTIKLQSARDYCADLARFSQGWLKSIGDAMIRNISEVAQYCNATSDKLLRGTDRAQRAIQVEFNCRRQSQSGSASFESFLIRVIEADMPKSEKQAEVSKYLQIAQLREETKKRLQQVGQFLVVEGQTEARAHPLQQVIIKGAGQTELRPLEAQINPPDVGGIALSLSGVLLPDVVSGFMDSVFDAFSGTFLGSDNHWNENVR